MGGRSSSSSSNTTQQFDTRVGASDEAIAVGGEGTTLNFNYQDEGVLNFAENIGGDLIDLTGKALAGALNVADKTAQLGSSTALSGLATVDNSKNGLADDVVKTIVPLGLGIAGLYFATKVLK